MKGLAGAASLGLIGTRAGSASNSDIFMDHRHERDEEDVLEDAEDALDEVLDANFDSTDLQRYGKDDKIAFNLAFEDDREKGPNPIPDTDLFGAALSSEDDELMYDLGDEYIRGATAIAEVVNEAIKDDELGDLRRIYFGPRSYFDSELPLQMEVRPDQSFDPEKKAERAYNLALREALETDERLNGRQKGMLNIFGFPDAYDRNHEIVVSEDVDGVRNDREDDGEFRLDDHAPIVELEDTELQGEHDPRASINVRYSDGTEYFPRMDIGEEVHVGDYKLELDFVDNERRIAGFEVEKGDYGDVSSPLPQTYLKH